VNPEEILNEKKKALLLVRLLAVVEKRTFGGVPLNQAKVLKKKEKKKK
jgi:hypothetical protein